MADPVFAAILKGTGEMTNVVARMAIDLAAEDWRGALQESGKADALAVTYPGMRSFIPAMVTPLAATAEAKLHRFERANKDIALTPGDCYPCMIVRAQIAQLQGENARADFWFDRAVNNAASIPFAEYEWGVRYWNVAGPTLRSKSSISPTRKARTSPILWKAGARR